MQTLNNLRFKADPDTGYEEGNADKMAEFKKITTRLMHEIDDLLLKRGKEKKYFKDEMAVQPDQKLLEQVKNEEFKENLKKEKEEQKKNDLEKEVKDLEKEKEELKPELDKDGKPDCNKFCEKIKNLKKEKKELETDKKEEPEEEDPEKLKKEADLFQLYLLPTYKTGLMKEESLIPTKPDKSILTEKDPNKPSQSDKQEDLTKVDAQIPPNLPRLSVFKSDPSLNKYQFH